MIVDCHTHINYAADNVGESEHLAAAETVDICIVLAAAENSSEGVNKKLSDYVSKHKEKMVGFAFIDPTKDKTSVKDLGAITEKLGLNGAVLYCCRCGFHPAHSRAMQFYELAQELSLPVFFHNGGHLGPEAVLDYAQPYLLDEVARGFPALKIVIGTMGAPFVEQTFSMVAKHENVYADLTIRPSNVWQNYEEVIAQIFELNSVLKKLFVQKYDQVPAYIKTKRILTASLASEPLTLKPDRKTDVNSHQVICNCSAGLFQFGSGADIIPGLCQDYSISKDGRFKRIQMFRERWGKIV